MSDDESKKLINKIITIVVAGLLLNVMLGGFWTYKLSYGNSLTNEFQEKQIQRNVESIKENEIAVRNITAQFYSISSDIKEIKNKLK